MSISQKYNPLEIEGLGILENYEKKTENVKVILTPIN